MINWASLLSDIQFFKKNAAATYSHLEWVHSEKQLPGSACDAIINLSKGFQCQEAEVVGEDKYPGHRQAFIRALELNSNTNELFSFLLNVASIATENHFHLSISGITRAPQYMEYVPGNGKFGWHNDYSHGGEHAPRKVTLIIQLSHPEEYTGGALQMFGIETEDLPKERGSVLVFPSICYHQVTEVTQGMRRALVAWIAGPKLL